MSECPASLFELENQGYRGWEFCLEVEHLWWERVGKGLHQTELPEIQGGLQGDCSSVVPSVGFSLWPRDDWVCTGALENGTNGSFHPLLLPPLSSCLHLVFPPPGTYSSYPLTQCHPAIRLLPCLLQKFWAHRESQDAFCLVGKRPWPPLCPSLASQPILYHTACFTSF